MVNIIWGALILIAIIYSLLTGNIDTINNGILTHATSGMNEFNTRNDAFNYFMDRNNENSRRLWFIKYIF